MSFKIQVLNRIKSKLTINAIIDIGVNIQTIELIKAFPDIHHYLFEIDPIYNDSIHSNYSDLKYSLHNVGLSDKSGLMFINSFSIHGNNQITHTVIRNQPINSYNGNVILSSKEVVIQRLDEVDQVFQSGCLMKIDVDGADVTVFKGAEGLLNLIDVVVIESTISKLTETIQIISSCGYFLADMADIIYYGECIYQVDLIFIRNEFRDLFVENFQPFKSHQWKHYLQKNNHI